MQIENLEEINTITIAMLIHSLNREVETTNKMSKIIEKQQRELQGCKRQIEVLEQTIRHLSNHVYNHLHAIEEVTDYDYLETICKKIKEDK